MAIRTYDADVLRHVGKGFLKTPQDTNPVFTGFELECLFTNAHTGNPVSAAETLIKDYGFFKHDGSINIAQSPIHTGAELVTLPCTLRYHKEVIARIFTSTALYRYIFNTLSDKCGMHIHISRDIFSLFQLGKFLIFMNSPKNKPDILHLAGRNEGSYWKLNPSFDIASLIDDPFQHGPGKYAALNASKHTTIEIRIFKAWVKRDFILRNLEFADAAARFVRETPAKLLDFETFISFVRKHGSSYPYLKMWFKATGNIKSKVQEKHLKVFNTKDVLPPKGVT